jgi:hypothetical protein
MRVDLNTMTLSMLDETTCIEYMEPDTFPWNHSIEWYGKVYMLGDDHIHVITKDCKKYNCIKNRG